MLSSLEAIRVQMFVLIFFSLSFYSTQCTLCFWLSLTLLYFPSRVSDWRTSRVYRNLGFFLAGGIHGETHGANETRPSGVFARSRRCAQEGVPLVVAPYWNSSRMSRIAFPRCDKSLLIASGKKNHPGFIFPLSTLVFSTYT